MNCVLHALRYFSTKWGRLMKSSIFLAIAISMAATSVHAKEVSFSGGSCSFTDMSTSGPLIIESCKNTRGVEATDLHVKVTLLDEKGGSVLLTSAPINVDFPAISGNGGVYTFPPEIPFGNGHLIWTAVTWQTEFGTDTVPIWGETLILDAHWTPPIPEPSSIALGISGLFMIGARGLKMRGRNRQTI